MKTKELKKLSDEFMKFWAESTTSDIERAMNEFWFATFRVNNKERESELLEYWKNS